MSREAIARDMETLTIDKMQVVDVQIVKQFWPEEKKVAVINYASGYELENNFNAVKSFRITTQVDEIDTLNVADLEDWCYAKIEEASKEAEKQAEE